MFYITKREVGLVKDRSIWDIQGDFYWDQLTISQRKEMEDLLEDMKIVYSSYRVARIKQIINRIIEARRNRSSVNEWDLKDFAIMVDDILDNEDITWEDLEKRYSDTKEEIRVATSYIDGIFNNSRIWKGHIDLLRSYKRQLGLGIPLTDKQTETLFSILKRYSKQIVSNQLL